MNLCRPDLSPHKTPMAVQPMPQRLNNLEEVALGYTPEQAMAEAARCLHCPDRYCSVHCPAHSYIPEFIAEVREGRFQQAWELLSRTNPMMDIASRVCPYERQCESRCTRGIRGEPVAIERLERFVADWHREHSFPQAVRPCPNHKRIAVVGSGPAGLTCAFSLASSGFHVVVYEKLNRLGGIPAWGVPPFVLPPAILKGQLQRLLNLGVEFCTGMELGKDISIETLRRDYDAVFVATGAELPVSPALPGIELPAVVQAKDYLTAPANYPGQSVLVFGGGGTAVDVARTALRTGAEQVKLVYRRTRADMPASCAELALAAEEGVELVELTAPLRFLTGSRASLRAECCRMSLTEPDYPGGRNNVCPSGVRVTLEGDLAVLALGFENRPVPGLKADEKHRICVDRSYAASLDGVFAGGDAVSGSSTLMKAVAAGKDAAAAIFDRLCDDTLFCP